jgi:hypothetical protein
MKHVASEASPDGERHGRTEESPVALRCLGKPPRSCFLSGRVGTTSIVIALAVRASTTSAGRPRNGCTMRWLPSR